MITVIAILVQKCIFFHLRGFRVCFLWKSLKIKRLGWEMGAWRRFFRGWMMQSGIIGPKKGCEKNF